MPVELNKNVLVGTVGYGLLSNHSIGPVLLPQLRQLDWPDGIIVDELNWGPIAIVQQFEALETPYDRVVFLIAIERPGRKIGEINIFQWKGGLPDERQIQACVGDAATGIISIDNLLVIGEYFKIWPKEVFIVDVEPGKEEMGQSFTPDVEAVIPEVLKMIQKIAVENSASLPAFETIRGEELEGV